MRIRTAVALAVLVVGGLLPLGSQAAATAPAMQITKAYWDSPGSDTGSNTSLNSEYVVLKNTGTWRVNLYNWTLRDTSNHVYRFSSTFWLNPGATVTVHTGKGTNTSSHRYMGRSWYVWNNNGDTAYLRNSAGSLRDSCSWTGATADWKYC